MIDPQAKAFLDQLAKLGMPPMHLLPAQMARAAYKQGRTFSQPPAPEVAAIRDLAIPGAGGLINCRLYLPFGSNDKQSLPGLVFYHGGGFVIGDLDTHDVLCRELANKASCIVISVDYRLSPEHKFPAAFDDAVASLKWVGEHATELGIDARRLAVGGDSAGGNLAAVAAIAARDSGGPALIAQLLIYPLTDHRNHFPSYESNDGYLLTREVIRYFRENYLNSAADQTDWRTSPYLAESLANLPPAIVLTAGYDPLRDEGKAYADRLRQSGVAVEYRCFDGQIHGFIMMGGIIHEANQAVDWCADGLKRAFIGKSVGSV